MCGQRAARKARIGLSINTHLWHVVAGCAANMHTAYALMRFPGEHLSRMFFAKCYTFLSGSFATPSEGRTEPKKGHTRHSDGACVSLAFRPPLGERTTAGRQYHRHPLGNRETGD